jgi:hypothetical protein
MEKFNENSYYEWMYEHGKYDEDGELIITNALEKRCPYKPKWDWYTAAGRFDNLPLLEPEYATALVAKKKDVRWQNENPEQIKEDCETFWRDYIQEENIEAALDKLPESARSLYSNLYTPQMLRNTYGDFDAYYAKELFLIPFATLDCATGIWNDMDEIPANVWYKTFYSKYIEPLEDDALVAIFDCHI